MSEVMRCERLRLEALAKVFRIDCSTALALFPVDIYPTLDRIQCLWPIF